MVFEFLKQRLNQFTAYHPTKRMTYEDGLMLMALLRAYEGSGDDVFADGLMQYLQTNIDPSGNIVSYEETEYNIDNILAGNVLFSVWDATLDPKFLFAQEALMRQLKHHPRTKSGSFWHKLRYPNQIWLDGLYMGQVFYYQYGLLHDDQAIQEDVKHQVENVRSYLWDETKKLYLHAYDETKSMQWAAKDTGRSPNVWSRSVGWFAMALVDLFELAVPVDVAFAKRLGALLTELLEGMRAHKDPRYSMWRQVVDRPDVEGNYLETSGSAMLAFAMIKGARMGMIDAACLEEGKQTIDGIDQRYLSVIDGVYELDGICSVAGLDNEKRDGSVAYYLSEKIAVNEIKGVAPYLYAKLEMAFLNTLNNGD
jgi:unsaturated rhamnogalacturonyl hydrolase